MANIPYDPRELMEARKALQDHFDFSRTFNRRTVDEEYRITPAVAFAMLERNYSISDATPYDGARPTNRRLSKDRVRKYMETMKSGRWSWTTQAIAFDTYDRLQDGQHRLSAVVESGVTITAPVWFGVPPECFQFLDQGKARDGADLMGNRLTYRAARAAIAKIQILLEAEDHSRSHLNAQAVLSRALSYVNDVKMSDALTASAPHRSTITNKVEKLASQTAGALAYYTIATKSESADALLVEFWRKLYTGIGTVANTGDPITMVRNFLMDNYNASSGLEWNIRTIAAIIIAWNEWLVWNKRGCPLNSRGKKKIEYQFEWSSTVTIPEVT